jgi:hypothetical protein
MDKNSFEKLLFDVYAEYVYFSAQAIKHKAAAIDCEKKEKIALETYRRLTAL